MAVMVVEGVWSSDDSVQVVVMVIASEEEEAIM